MSQHSPPSDDRAAGWIVAIHAGLRAYDEMVTAFQAHLAALAQKELTPDVQASLGASGLVQDTWVAVLRGFRRFRGSTEAELLAWMGEILHNRLRREQRRVRAAKRDVRRKRPLRGRDSESGSVMALVDPAPTPGSVAERKEGLERIREAARGLPLDQRMVLLLKAVHGLSDAEIGALLDCSANVVGVKRFRAVKQLRRTLGDGNGA